MGIPDLEAVILSCGDGARLYPLTEECPLSLVPVLNIPILQHQLLLLEESGFNRVLVVTAEESSSQIFRFLDEYTGSLNVDRAIVDGSLDTADVIRQVRDKITTDFLLWPGDLICEQEHVKAVLKEHRIKCAILTMVLLEESMEVDKKGKMSRPKRDDEDIDCIGLAPDNRVVMKAPLLDMDEVVEVQKALLRMHTTFTLGTSLLDIGLYVISHAVLQFLEEHRGITSVQDELAPALIRQQFVTPPPILPENSRKLGSSLSITQDLGQSSNQIAIERYESMVGDLTCGIRPESKNHSKNVFSVTIKSSASRVDAYCCQAKTLAMYSRLNKELLELHFNSQISSSYKLTGLNKKDQTLIGEGCSIGEKVTCKTSIIGRGCTISNRCKLNNCIIMDGCTIGDGCIIQNTIVCANATIGENSNLNDCQIGTLHQIAPGTKAKGEAFTRST